ncbi:sirohydrochlorin chelatase [Staphylococcus massiliensis]|uniref:sirohydrochlorin chelatase n=1 Tax=Staphylococcus massiliensis TaxID=555791 RepID=UPI001EDD8E93|nr:sirohydrochlorin chelatase [Staphylococcus massiliensis]MCG3399288.1 sirohydrochlorin chelatase [Staphylococcus massiliensis]
MQTILVVHGMRKGPQNDALKTFIHALLAEDTLDFEVAFLESETSSLEQVIDRHVARGERDFNLIPLLLFTALHYSVDIPEIMDAFKARYDDISFKWSLPLGTHPDMVDIVEKRVRDARIQMRDTVSERRTAVVVIAHGSFKFQRPDYELETLCEQLSLDEDAYAYMLYGNKAFETYLPDIAERYTDLIVVPLFLYDGYLVNKIKRKLESLALSSTLHIRPSLNLDSMLRDIIISRYQTLKEY